MLDVAPPTNQDEYEEDLGIIFSNLVRSDWRLGSVMKQGSEEFLNAIPTVEVFLKLSVWKERAIAFHSSITTP